MITDVVFTISEMAMNAKVQCLSINIVILLVSYTVPFDFKLFWQFILYYTSFLDVLLRITN